VNSDDDVTCPR